MTHPLLERLAGSDPDDRRAACAEAARDPSAVLWIEALVEALGDPDKAVARAASDALATIGRTAPEVGAALRPALHGDDPMRRWGAAFTTARLEPPSEKLLPALVEALGLPDGDVRWAAAKILVETGRLVDSVLPLLLGLARGCEAPVVRRMATYCLRELAPDRPESAAALLEASRDEDLALRRAGLTALASLMEPPPAVLERLVEALAGDPDPASRRIAAAALGEVGAARREALPAGAMAALQRARASAPDCDLRAAATRALERLGAPQRSASRD
ncbi:MAG: HEAT repeat domain-containing protein [Myxococcales bacterium]|nr:HEAT repeat domain-containing protein [Myxococcales bacterium]